LQEAERQNKIISIAANKKALSGSSGH